MIESYNNSIWLADGVRFDRYLRLAMARPCPSAAEVRSAHKSWCQAAADVVTVARQSVGKSDVPDSHAELTRINAVKGKIGVIPIYGPVDQRTSGELEKSGGTPLDFVSMAFDTLMDNPAVGAIVLRIDSPGGSVYGTEELSNRIFAARGRKPIYAIADSLAASAAYWIASSADMIVATPGGDVGSVGVYVMHVDESAAMEKEGVRVTLVSAGQHKTEFSPYSPLSATAKAEAQARVDGTYEKFLNALKRNRGTSIENVRENYGKGRVLTAEKALAAGMIDRVLSFEQLIGKLGGSASAASRGPSADFLRAKAQHHMRGRKS